MPKKAFFRFEASPQIGAGHAIRSCVIADALSEKGWDCKIVTSENTYEFIENLKHFERISPEEFFINVPKHDLLVIDNYDLDFSYEAHFRSFASKILVIDDLANRKHECDILIDQTFGRDTKDYDNLVPRNCIVLTGTSYTLLRKQFTDLRAKALKKRKRTKEIKKILISFGGGNQNSGIIEALQMIEKSNCKSDLDIVLGFQDKVQDDIISILKSMPNAYKFHVNPVMAELIYEADLAIGAAGSSVWERSCLGLPQVVVEIADNQNEIASLLSADTLNDIIQKKEASKIQNNLILEIDGKGSKRLLAYISQIFDNSNKQITFNKIKQDDLLWTYECQIIPKLRMFSINQNPPDFLEHKEWFTNKIQDCSSIFEKIICNNKPCGTLRLDYQESNNCYILSWYILPEFQNNGIGTIALEYAKYLVDEKIKAFALFDNTASNKALLKAGFKKCYEEKKGTWYEY